MKKVLIINSSPNKCKGKTEIILNAVEKGFADIEIEKIYLSDYKVQKCIKTDSCKIIKSQNYFKERKIIELITKLNLADIVVLGSPLYETGMTIDLQVLLELYSPKETDLTKTVLLTERRKENQKWILVSTCQYPEMGNFFILNKQFKELSELCGAEIILKIYRPYSDLLELDKESPYIQEFLNTCTETVRKLEEAEILSSSDIEKLYKEVIVDVPEIIQ